MTQRPTLTQKELSILRKKTQMSYKEIQLWHQQFYENYPMGKANKKQFIESFKGMVENDDLPVLSQQFDIVDRNGDGLMDFGEYLFALTLNSTKISLEERLEDIFDLWDVSDDGHLDENELSHLISAMYDATGVKDRKGIQNPTTRAKLIIAKLDANGDRKLTKEEFVQGCINDEIIAKLFT